MLVYVSDNHNPAWNLAAEECFFQGKHEICMIYMNRPSVIIGCNQAWENEVDIDWCRANDIPVLRRISGGGAVYHDEGNLNYSFISNKKTGVDNLSGNFLEPVISTLAKLNVPAVMGKRKDVWLSSGYKISGTASHIIAQRVIHHGTLLYDVNLKNLEKSLLQRTDNKPVRAIASVPSPVKNIRTYLQENDIENFNNDVFFRKFIDLLIQFIPFDGLLELNENQKNEIERLCNSKYISDEWNFRK
jgi:lipoate-protein ligase A